MSSSLRHRLASTALAALALAAAACSRPLTELVVVVRSDASDLRDVGLRVTGPDGTLAFEQTEMTASSALPLTLGLTRDAAPFGPIRVEVVAHGDVTGEIRRTVSTSFVEGARRRLEIVLQQVCAGVSCGDGTTCVDGACRADAVDPSRLPAFDGTVPPVDAGPGFDAGPPDAGLTDAGPPDAGPSDAGPPDAGPPDAGPPPCDGRCVAGEVCVYGECAARPWSSVAIGDGHLCVVASAPGPVLCTGANANGQLGDGTLTASVRWSTVRGIPDAVEVSAGRAHTCAVTAGGGVLCWGANDALQLGAPADVSRSPVPVAVAGLSGTSIHVYAGENHTCATVDGALHCWGGNTAGQLGDGTRVSRETVGAVLLTGVTDVAASSNFTCAVVDGATFCWGNNAQGQLGDGSTTARATPTRVTYAPRLPTVPLVDRVVAGRSHACAKSRAGGVFCWGDASTGQLGDGASVPRSNAEPTTDFGLVDGLSGGTLHVIARRRDGQIWGWGDNLARQLDGALPGIVRSPTRLSDPDLVDAAWAGYSTTCWWASSVGPRCVGRVRLP